MHCALYPSCRVHPFREEQPNNDARGFSVHTIYHIEMYCLSQHPPPYLCILWRVNTRAHTVVNKAFVE